MEIEGLTVLQKLYSKEDNCRCDFRVGRTFEGQGIVLGKEQKQGSHFQLKWSGRRDFRLCVDSKKRHTKH